MEEIVFESPIKGKWDNIDSKTLEYIEAQAKERHHSTLSESESVTKKTITVLIGLFGFMSYMASFKLINYELPKNYIFKFMILALGIFIVGMLIDATKFATQLLFPKGIRQTGLSPSTAIPENIMTVDPNLQYKFLVYNRIKIYEDDIEFMQKQNSERVMKYKRLIERALIIFIATLFCVVLLISHL